MTTVARIRTRTRSRAVRLGAAALTAAGALAGLAPTAGAAPGDTTATFSITAGGLSISVPASTVALNTGTVNTGASSAAGQLGNVTVTDDRGALVATWTATVSSTTFTTGTATANETVALDKISYASGLASSTSGTGTFTPQLGVAMNADSTLRFAAKWAAGVGNNSATWNPTLTFTLLSSQVAGTYTGTINHSVA